MPPIQLAASQARVASRAHPTQSGAVWMQSGIPLVFAHQYDSAAVLLK